MRLVFPVLALLLAVPLPASADKPDPSKSNLPVEVKLVAKKTTYKMDTDGKELKKQLEAAKDDGKYPMPPVVDLTLEIRNRSDKDVQVWLSGDPVQIVFELKGPGAVTVKPMRFFTTDFRIPLPMKIAAGKTQSLPLGRLSGGFRSASEYSYWTEPGDYTLSVRFLTGVSPAPEGFKADESGFARVTIPSEPIKIKVEEK